MSPLTTFIPSVGTGPNEIDAVITTTTGSYAVFESCSLSGAIFPGASQPGFVDVPLIITTTDMTCDEKQVKIEVPNSPSTTALPALSFDCYAKYSRTFVSTDGSRQIYRFLLNGESDWYYEFIVPTGTPGVYTYYDDAIPDCWQKGPINPSVFPAEPFVRMQQPIFKGFIDYAVEADGSGGRTWSVRLALTHHDGCVAHANYPGLNDEFLDQTTGAIAYRHNLKSYHLVAPAAGFNWLAPLTVNTEAGRFITATVARGEARSLADPLLRLGGSDPICLTEFGFYWDLFVRIVGCACSGTTPQTYYHHDFEPQVGPFVNYPGQGPGASTAPPSAQGFYNDLSTTPPTTVVSPISRIPNLPWELRFPIFRQYLGSWASTEPWSGGVKLFVFGSWMEFQDPYNTGPSGPHPDPGEAAHLPTQFCWGITTDHVDQDPLTDAPVLIGTTIHPELLTDFANQLVHRAVYSPPVLPVYPEPNFGTANTMSTLVWQITE